MNKLIPLSLAIASVLAFPAIAQAQSFSLNDGGAQGSNYIRLVSEERVSEARVSENTVQVESSVESSQAERVQTERVEHRHVAHSHSGHTPDPAKRISHQRHGSQVTGLDAQKTMYTTSVSSSSSSLTESGRRPSQVPSGGWAKDMPLALAVRQVVPSDFSVKENGVALSQLVSWSGDLSWPTVLGQLSRQGQFMAHIDWDRKEVSLAPAFVSRQSLPNTTQHTTTQHTTVIAHSSPKHVRHDHSISTGVHSKDDASALSTRVIRSDDVAVSTQTTVVSSSNNWTLDPKMTLRQNIEKWAAKVGWHVVWEAADYSIIAPASFSGEFASPTGPLARLIAAYERSDQPLVAKLTTMDKVVYVRNKYYENTEVVPTSSSELSSELFQDIKN